MADISQVKLPNGDTYNLVDETSGYIKNYTETDPVFTASAAAGITAADISNWNAKVSDDKTWNGVTLNKSNWAGTDITYVPHIQSMSGTSAYYIKAANSPTQSALAKYDSNSYLYSTTPSANDNSTKVATTAYVDSAVGGITVPTKTSDLTNDSGFITDAAAPFVRQQYSGTVTSTAYIYLRGQSFTDGGAYTMGFKTPSSSTEFPTIKMSYHNDNHLRQIEIHYLIDPTADQDAANKAYVDAAIPQVYSSTNTGGYLTMATLPIYDGTVV